MMYRMTQTTSQSAGVSLFCIACAFMTFITFIAFIAFIAIAVERWRQVRVWLTNRARAWKQAAERFGLRQT